MRHWDTVLPGRVLRVAVRGLIEGLDGGVQRMLAIAACPSSLPAWPSTRPGAACARPVPNRCVSPSAAKGSPSGENYAPWLEPLRDALGDALTGYKD
jgi:hypothetical protein